MLMFLTAALAVAASTAPAPLDAIPQTRLDDELRCHLGVYALPAGRSLTITGADGQPRALQYTFSNGQFGNLQEREDGTYSGGSFVIRFERCAAGKIKLTRGELVERGVRLRLIEKTTTFTSDGIRLHGKLVSPPSGDAKALAVWIEGSNNDPSTDDSVWQYELASRGVAVFLYDKRGTGASAGAPSSDFHARARDTAAAVKEARRLAPGVRRVGVVGGSQGGWVAPLAATLTPLDFVVAAFAMAEGPIAQDQALVAQQLRQAGFDGAALAGAEELTAITEKIVRSNMRDGLADLDAFKSKYAGSPWLDAIQPRSYTGLFLKFNTEQIRTNGPALAQGLSFDYEPRPVIEAIKARQLWLLGGNDRQAPNAATQTILRQIQQRRRDIAVVVFPKADHGLIEPVKTADGVAMAYSATLFEITADWIKHRKLPAPGNFIHMPNAD
ncbi:MAG: alpha/beta fold hydrolase [Lysobacteraceae bacterium]|nr:MAG: alpha/beta fold hydrolase [Xanthomonadaceae bacterium]